MSAGKLLWAVVGTVATFLVQALPDSQMSPEEWVTLFSLVLGAFGTWLVPNTSALATAKLWVFALVAGAGVLASLLVGGVTWAEWVTVGIAVLTAAGVYVAPPRADMSS